jgi:hypothetical protein
MVVQLLMNCLRGGAPSLPPWKAKGAHASQPVMGRCSTHQLPWGYSHMMGVVCGDLCGLAWASDSNSAIYNAARPGPGMRPKPATTIENRRVYMLNRQWSLVPGDD